MGWQKGQSGNPGGRIKNDARVKDLAQQHTELAISTLVEICENKKYGASSRVAAATSLLDRGWGRPAQAIVGGGEDDPPIQLSEIIIRAVDAAGDRAAPKGS
jgi:hypothetical protein